jgi:sensor histidine kinase regulating citrate/malate metabolism
MDNAIEAVSQFQQAEKRQIEVTIFRQQCFLVIKVVNPSPQSLVFQEGLPVTTKEDPDHHGFGLRSVRHIVEKYDGNLCITDKDGEFSLKILIPTPQAT